VNTLGLRGGKWGRDRITIPSRHRGQEEEEEEEEDVLWVQKPHTNFSVQHRGFRACVPLRTPVNNCFSIYL